MNSSLAPWLANPPGESLFSKKPKHVSLEITGHCQLSCHHCFNESGPGIEHELPLEVIERLMDEMMTWGLEAVRISGGEPTLHAQFRAVVAACEKRAINIVLNSHGVYSRELLEWLCTAPISRFLISLDGSKESHEAIRGKGTFDRAVVSCRALRRAGQNLCIGFHVGRSNQNDLVELIELAAEIGADFKLSPIRPSGRAAYEMSGELIQPEQFCTLVQEVNRLRRRYPHIHLFTDFDIFGGKDKAPKNMTMPSCKAGRTMLNISYSGEIYPCAFFATADRRFSAGNIHHDSITDIWSESPVFEPFRIYSKADVCQRCPHYQQSCVGGCPAVSYFTTGFWIPRIPPVLLTL